MDDIWRANYTKRQGGDMKVKLRITKSRTHIDSGKGAENTNMYTSNLSLHPKTKKKSKNSKKGHIKKKYAQTKEDIHPFCLSSSVN